MTMSLGFMINLGLVQVEDSVATKSCGNSLAKMVLLLLANGLLLPNQLLVIRSHSQHFPVKG